MRRASTALAAVFVVVILVSCGGGNDVSQVSTAQLSEVASATSASTAKVKISQQVEDGPTMTFEGEVDFDLRAAHLRGDFDPLAGVPEADVARDFTALLAELYDIMAAATEMITIDDTLYLQADGQWWDFGTGTTEEGMLDLLSPESLLQQLADLGDVEALGDDQVRGEPARHFTATDDRGMRYDIWIDDLDRAVRVDAASADPAPGELADWSMEFLDFGAPVSIDAPNETRAAPTPSPLDVDPAIGDDLVLKEVASGSEDGVSWMLSTGPVGDGRSCVHIDTDPALDGEVVIYGPDGSSSTSAIVPAGDPLEPSCGPTEAADLATSGAMLLAVGGRESDVHYLAGLLQGDATVTVTFTDGRTETLVGHNGAFALFFSGNSWPTLISGDAITCELNGDNTTSGSDFLC